MPGRGQHGGVRSRNAKKCCTGHALSRSAAASNWPRWAGLAAGVAHEINNPLTGGAAFADLLREKENLDDQDRQDLDLIIRETKRRGKSCGACWTSPAKRPPARPCSRSTTWCGRPPTPGKTGGLRTLNLVEDLAEPLPPIHGDRNQLQQVLVNLSLNACEAMPGGGTLLVSTAAAGNCIVIKVIDTGSGIRREHVDKIFEPFFTTKPVGKGTGLGLSVSYGIVQQHGGSLEVESQEGKGTTFTVTLPLALAAEG